MVKLKDSRWVYFGGLSVAYTLTHLLSLDSLPLLGDEGVHLWWAKRFLEGDVLRSLNVGAPWEPLLIVPGMLLGMNAMIWARLMHALVGALAMVSLVDIGKRLFSVRSGWFAGLLFVVLPYATFFSRLALTEILMAAAGLCVMWMTLNAKDLRKDLWVIATGLGMVLGFSSKMPIGVFWSIVPPVFVLCGVPSARQAFCSGRTVLKLYLPLVVVLGCVGVISYHRIRYGLSPGFGLQLIAGQSGQVLSPGTSERILRNASLATTWLISYLTWPLCILSLVSLTWSLLFGSPEHRSIMVLVIAGIAPFVIIAESWHADYLFFVAPMLCILSGDMLSRMLRFGSRYLGRVQSGMLASACLGSLLLSPILKSAIIQFVPELVRLPATEREMYIEGWPAGYGFPEASAWLVQSEPSLVVTYFIADYQQTRAYLPTPVPFSLRQVHVLDRDALSETARLDHLAAIALDQSSFILVLPDSNHKGIPQSLRARGLSCDQITAFTRPGGRTAVTLYQVATDSP